MSNAEEKNPQVDFFFNKTSPWQEAYFKLRQLALDCPLKEELKWGCPCYTFENNNVVLIHGFKDYCALLFMKGALLHDPQGRLIQQTKNVQAARQMRFTDLREILDLETEIKAFILQAIQLEKQGVKVELKKTEAYEMPQELETILQTTPALKKAFYQLTPGRQRAYLLYFSQAKQSKTRLARIEKYLPYILIGKGLKDV